MGKVGRPKVENRRSVNLSWRVTEEEYAKLKAFAEEHQMTISQIFQKGVELLYQKKG